MKRNGRLTFDKIAGEIFLGTLVCQLILIGIYWLDVLTHSRFQPLHVLFDLDGEGNIPAWFSSAQLLVVALALWTHALRQPRGLRPSRAFFSLAGCAALYASMDEAGQVHEQVTAWMGRRYVDWLPGYVGKHFLIAMIAVALIVSLFQLIAADILTLWFEHRRILAMLALGLCIGLLGCMGVETMGYKLLHGSRATIWYNVEVTVEEFMEMFGATVILCATLKLNRTLAAKRSRAENSNRLRHVACDTPVPRFT